MIDALKANNGKYTGYNSTKKEAKILRVSVLFRLLFTFYFRIQAWLFNDLPILILKKIHLKFQYIYDEKIDISRFYIQCQRLSSVKKLFRKTKKRDNSKSQTQSLIIYYFITYQQSFFI